MFTGIVEEIGRVEEVRSNALRLAAPILAPRCALGDSVAVNGVCLTVTRLEPAAFLADVSSETLSKTTLGKLARGSRVNLETALTAGKPLGGHFVQGHVDAVGSVHSMEKGRDSWILRISYPLEFARLVVPRGSIAVDGVSLTVAEIEPGEILRIALIPLTSGNTVMEQYQAGQSVNLEFDVLGKYVQRYLETAVASSGMPAPTPLSLDTLRDLGY